MGIPPKKGEPEDLQIKPETPVFQIKNIMFHTLCNGRVPAPSVHLCLAGNTGFGLVAHLVMGNFLFELFYKVFSFRARSHKAHVPNKNVP